MEKIIHSFLLKTIDKLKNLCYNIITKGERKMFKCYRVVESKGIDNDVTRIWVLRVKARKESQFKTLVGNFITEQMANAIEDKSREFDCMDYLKIDYIEIDENEFTYVRHHYPKITTQKSLLGIVQIVSPSF